MKGIVVAPVTIAVHHLLALVTAAPQVAVEPMVSVHVSGVRKALWVAVHVLNDLGKMDHLDVIVEAVPGNGCVVRPFAEVARTIWGEWDGAVIEAVEVDDVDRRVRHRIVTSQRRAAYRSYRGQRGRESGHCSGPDKHTWGGRDVREYLGRITFTSINIL